jgi:solute carrier family 35 protein C2
MCKSSVLGFVLIFAIIFRLEKPSWKLGAIILVMTIGVVLMVAGETSFNVVGFTLLMVASLASGLRWSLTQMLLRRTPATSNPFSTLFFLTPVMFLTLFVIAVPVEGFGPLHQGFVALAETRGLFMGIMILLFPGVLAFCMTSAEFALLKRTSVVTLSVCGIFKEVLTISAASIVFGDQLTPINISGLCVTLTAIISYNYIRIKKMKRQEVKKAQAVAEQTIAEENAPMLASRSTANNPTQDDTVRRTSLGMMSAPPPTYTPQQPPLKNEDIL